MIKTNETNIQNIWIKFIFINWLNKPVYSIILKNYLLPKWALNYVKNQYQQNTIKKWRYEYFMRNYVVDKICNNFSSINEFPPAKITADVDVQSQI